MDYWAARGYRVNQYGVYENTRSRNTRDVRIERQVAPSPHRKLTEVNFAPHGAVRRAERYQYARTIYRFPTISFMASIPCAGNGPMALLRVNHMPFSFAGR